MTTSKTCYLGCLFYTIYLSFLIYSNTSVLNSNGRVLETRRSCRAVNGLPLLGLKFNRIYRSLGLSLKEVKGSWPYALHRVLSNLHSMDHLKCKYGWLQCFVYVHSFCLIILLALAGRKVI